MTETGKVFLRYLYKRFWWKVIHHRKKLFCIIHKRAFETSMKKLKFVIFTNAPCKGLNSNRHSVTVHSVNSNVAKIHSRLPAAMEFWLVCLGILAYSCQNTSRDSGV